MRRITEAKDFLSDNLIAAGNISDGYITVEGTLHIKDKMLNMLNSAEKRIYISLSSVYISDIKCVLEQLVLRGIKVVIITDNYIDINGAIIYFTESTGNQIRLIVDSEYVLTGDFCGNGLNTCLYSGQKNFVRVLKEAMRNEIKLIELRGNKNGD